MTAPKFLGYSFNPVSFWYLYDKTRKLIAMILEVNNTFDERRMYFLEQAAGCDVDKAIDDDPIETLPHATLLSEFPPSRFSNTWSKDFHVSPFNSRKGSYSLKAEDPFSPRSTSGLSISNTITLSSSKGHPKLVARIDSTAASIDPSKLGIWGVSRFIASWWWVGLVTFPRIVREAAKLFFKRKLHVWFRPEVARSSIARKATTYET